jgi:hypothetical protein
MTASSDVVHVSRQRTPDSADYRLNPSIDLLRACSALLSSRPADSSALPITLDRAPLALRSTRNRPRRALRRGASWTAAYHVQLTVAAVARPVRSSMVPPRTPCCRAVLGLLLTQTVSARRSLQPASSVGRRRGRQCQDASRGVGRRSVSSMRCPTTHPGSSGVRLSGRPVSSQSGVRSPGVVVRGPAVRPVCCPPVQPSGVQPSGVQPSAVHPSVRTRPSPPTLDGGVGTRLVPRGQPSPQEAVEVPVVAVPSSRSVDGPAGLGRRRCRGRTLVNGVAGAWPGGCGRGRPLGPLSDQAG